MFDAVRYLVITPTMLKQTKMRQYKQKTLLYHNGEELINYV